MVKTGADCDKVGEESVEGRAPAGAGGSTGSGRGEVESGRFSDEREALHSPYGEEGSPGPADGGAARRRDLSGSSSSSSVSACCSDVDLEAGEGGGVEIQLSLAKVEKDCRICHMGLESSSHESGVAIELGCSCKDDLAAAHKQCAETWFKIKGNKTCEICGSTASNVASNVASNNETTEVVEQRNETTNAAQPTTQETRSFWRGHRFLNFLLSCMVFAFVISWLFHFNVPS